MSDHELTDGEWALLRQLFNAGARGVWPGDLVQQMPFRMIDFGLVERCGPGDGSYRITEGGVAALFGVGSDGAVQAKVGDDE